ncbi:MAG TPA: cupredoxin domain-containing protein [Candidatus Nanoarchaeia archaeon]|nr:cupredoxin domain-containing protein [Candidatus Nanoarchaeia archaeon]
MKKKKDANLYVKILAGAVIVVLVALALMNYKPLPTRTEEMRVPTTPVLSEGNYQQAMLTYTAKGYEMVPSVLKAGIPVHVMVDLESISGCLRSITIPQLGVEKTVSEGDHVFEFTPTTPGEYKIICAMGMGTGTFRVE